MSVVYSPNFDVFLWGELQVTEHLGEMRTIALYWRGVQEEMRRHRGDGMKAHSERIGEFIAELEKADLKLRELDHLYWVGREQERKDKEKSEPN